MAFGQGATVIKPWSGFWNITLNALDWLLEERGLKFVRYADDFVVLCPSKAQAQAALTAVQSHLSESLGLTLSPEKTMVTTFQKGFSFLGFTLSSRSVTMRSKSVGKFKDKVRELTRRSRNLDQHRITVLNRVIRGTARCFATPFSQNRSLFEHLDAWIRVRLRAMKYKRKWRTDNKRLRIRHFRRMGLLELARFCHSPA